MLRRAGLLDIAHAAMDLHAERSDLIADIGRECLGNRREQRAAFMRRGAGALIAVVLAAIERDRGGIAERASGAGWRAAGQQRAVDVGVRDDRARTGCAGGTTLLAFARIGER